MRHGGCACRALEVDRMRLTRTILGLAAAAAFSLTPAYADHGHAPAQKPTTVAGKPAATTTGKNDHGAKPTTTRSTTTKSSHGSPTTSKPTSSHGSTTTSSSTKGSKKAGTGTTPSTTPTTAMNPIATKISSHQQLKAKVTAMLPPNTTLNDASKGFRNQGQFIAALHASQRMDCGGASCFTLLKADMVDKHMSLGQSIQDVRHTTSSTATKEAARAEHE